MSTLNLPRIREPEHWSERFFCPEEPLDSDFQNLQWLYTGESPVVVGYRSKVYSVSVEKVEKIIGIGIGTFAILELYVRICDYADGHAITCMLVNTINSPTVLDEVKKQISKFIKQGGQESTDFYK